MKPYPHQEIEVEHYAAWPRRALYWSPRIGKSLGTILSLQRGLPKLRRGCVVAPYGVCGQWARLLEANGYHVVRLYDQPNTGAVTALGDVGVSNTIAVVNYQRLPQAAATVGSRHLDLADVLMSWGLDAFVIDESHYIVSPSAKWATRTRQIAWNTPWVRCLSGTPAPNHYGNLWGQVAALNPDEFGWAYKHFADKYLVLDNLYKSRVWGYKNLEEELLPALRRYCSFVRRDDVFGPDQWIVNVREVEMPAKAARLYAKLAREWLIDDPDEVLRVDGAHILTRLIRLQQLASGYVTDDETGEERLVHTAKLDDVEADLGEIIAMGEKAIVFHRFRWEGRELAERLGGKVRLLTINGETPSIERDEVQRAIEQDPGPIVAIVQTKSGGIGISFARSNYALVVSQSFSFVEEEQARDRIYELKQGVVVPKHVMYYRTMGTVDEFIAERIEHKEASHDALTRINRQDMVFGSWSKKRQRKLDMVPAGAYSLDTSHI